jgi:hypothetical protein
LNDTEVGEGLQLSDELVVGQGVERGLEMLGIGQRQTVVSSPPEAIQRPRVVPLPMGMESSTEVLDQHDVVLILQAPIEGPTEVG